MGVAWTVYKGALANIWDQLRKMEAKFVAVSGERVIFDERYQQLRDLIDYVELGMQFKGQWDKKTNQPYLIEIDEEAATVEPIPEGEPVYRIRQLVEMSV